eukprot:1159414-Pelagomonas_calceolata.AAC.5
MDCALAVGQRARGSARAAGKENAGHGIILCMLSVDTDEQLTQRVLPLEHMQLGWEKSVGVHAPDPNITMLCIRKCGARDIFTAYSNQSVCRIR